MTTVLVTGASGFIAKHIIRELLESNYRVKASIRSDKGRRQVQELFPEADIEFVTLDLTSDQGWGDAMAGVDVLIHTASPFPGGQPKDRMELIRPAVDGTQRALDAANDAGVHRVVLTSSCVAIYKDDSKPSNTPSTRENWTNPDGSGVTAYEASKTLAERAAWNFVKAHPEMQLTVINPGIVFGPPMDTHYGTSLELIEQYLTGKMPASPKINAPMVDVRDVARMHVRAIDNPDTVGQRFPATAGAPYMVDIASVLNDAFPDRKISTKQLPNFVVKALGRVNPLMKTISDNIGVEGAVDGSDGPRVMDFEYISVPESIRAAAGFIVKNGKA